ncbi:MAG: hypothetical protein LBI54_08160 [Lachnospiraceae bacterium]|jgi:hypothetical protein|nr:hypothetical protein [Lachnospiraceae bacterium]
MPLTGYFSAFLIYPLVGDYLTAASISLALVTAAFISLFFVVLYIFFYTVSKSKSIGIMAAMMVIALCFALFKGRSEPLDNVPTLFAASNVHMFYAKAYNLYFFYVFPNILNSIMVLALLRLRLRTQKLSLLPAAQTPYEMAKAGCLLAGIYFCIFSMLFSAGILLAFAAAVIVCRFVSAGKKNRQPIKEFAKECIRDYNILLVIILGTIIAMILELQSGRSNAAHHENTYFGSLFDTEFLRRIGEAAVRFAALFGSMNKLVVLLLFVIIVAAGILYAVKANSRKNQAIGLLKESLAAMALLFLFYIIVAAKAGPKYLGEIWSSYGVFFFLLLAVGLVCVYVLQELKQAGLFFPLILTIIILLVPNQMWPYYSVSRSQQSDPVRAIIASFVEADSQGITEIELYLPERQLEKWQYDWQASLLYAHRVTANRIIINDVKVSPDNSVYFVP